MALGIAGGAALSAFEPEIGTGERPFGFAIKHQALNVLGPKRGLQQKE